MLRCGCLFFRAIARIIDRIARFMERLCFAWRRRRRRASRHRSIPRSAEKASISAAFAKASV